MKKNILFAAIVVSSMFITACTTHKEELGGIALPPGVSAESIKEHIETNVLQSEDTQELSNYLNSYQIKINGDVLQVPMQFSELKDAGWEYGGNVNDEILPQLFLSSMRWKKDDLTICTDMYNDTVNTLTVENATVVFIEISENNMEQSEAEVVLPGGIEVGVASKEDIIAAYGMPTYESEESGCWKGTYAWASLKMVVLTVSDETGVLSAVSISNADTYGYVNEEVDSEQEIIEYTAPTELGTDLYNVQFELNQQVYRLPCPISEFIKDGFVLKGAELTDVIYSNHSASIRLTCGEIEFYVDAVNLFDNATTLENCYVTKVNNSIGYGEVDITIPGGITMDSTISDVWNIVSGFNHEVEVSATQKIYYVYEEGGSKYDALYKIEFENDKLSRIVLENEQL